MKKPPVSPRAKIYRLKRSHAEELEKQRKVYNQSLLDLQIKQAGSLAQQAEKEAARWRESVTQKNQTLDAQNKELAALRSQVSLLSDQNYKLMGENDKLKARMILDVNPPKVPKKLSWWQRFLNWNARQY